MFQNETKRHVEMSRLETDMQERQKTLYKVVSPKRRSEIRRANIFLMIVLALLGTGLFFAFGLF